MILTITLNSALDKVIFIDEFVPASTSRSNRVIESVGGKGLDASVVLQTLGVPNLALGFVAGKVGDRLVRLLDDYGIQHDLTHVEGETRIAHVIVETNHQRHTHITTGAYRVKDDDIDRLMERFKHHIKDAEWVICGGSLPEGTPDYIYREVTEIANEKGVSTLLDGKGKHIRHALEAFPTVIKLNKEEFFASFNEVGTNLDEVKSTALRIRKRENIPALIVTCGEEGIIAVVPEGCYHAKSPLHDELNAAGAGDAVSAAVAWRRSLGDTWEATLKWASATSTAVILTEGTADCRMEDIKEILPKVTVELSPSPKE